MKAQPYPLIPQPTSPAPVVAQLRGLHVAFGTHTVLRGVDLTLHEGENLVIMGGSGAGKSVLIKTLVGLATPTQGQVCLFGDNLAHLPTRQAAAHRHRVGYLFQGGALYDAMTIGQNLAFPLARRRRHLGRRERQHRVAQALDEVGLPGIADRMPNEISGGMQKRVALARALILEPEVMLYDEPTTGLDPITSQEICELIVRLRQQHRVASLIVTHDPRCTDITGDYVYFLREGCFAAEGTPSQVRQHPEAWVRAFFS